ARRRPHTPAAARRRPAAPAGRAARRLKRRFAGVASLDAQVFLPVAPRALPHDHFLVAVAERELVARDVGVFPQSVALALLALVDQPVVVALVDDVAFRRVHGGGANAPVELAPEGNLLLREVRRPDVGLVAGLFQLPAGDGGEDFLVAQAELALVDADIPV